ncbi:HD domain-containing protein [Erysipelatoclostridium ramosum]|uniref:HD domain-containing protein n=1 Tax=Thomasclavelia ramosa TaxID=1547 RepID=A0AB35ITK9_9FIRM|nr:HD domain-containing protein [Thomasclavelia ramosa]MDB7085492.1 HD domain-containing protein [Thomasclavelia ramosa]
MEPRELLNALAIVERLKDTTRHCYTSKGRHESVTEHSWMMTVMAFLMINEFPEANMNKVIQMCIIHDLGECFTGDIPVFMKNKENENVEERLLNEWVESLPKVTRNLMKESIWKRRKDRLLNQKYIRQ